MQTLLLYLHKLEDLILSAILTLVLVLAASQILLRNIFDISLFWAEPLMRAMVLWLALLGALVAGRDGKHISIDLLSHVLPTEIKIYLNSLAQLIAGVICSFLSYHALVLVELEYEYSSGEVAGIPIWCVQLILPFGFLLMALRFFVQTGLGLFNKNQSTA